MEIQPNFANSGKCYLVGLAVTDDPAASALNTSNSAAPPNTTRSTASKPAGNLFRRHPG
jgi:hypothetical protein